MTPDDMRKARAALGDLYGLARPLTCAELGRLLRLGGRDPGRTVTRWETGATPIRATAVLAVEMMLAGALPPTLEEAIRK